MNTKTENQTHVLLVEDEPAAREASSRYLRMKGFDVVTAGNADDALSAAHEQQPDVLVCDWRLGKGRDGVDVARALQARCDVSVIFVSAHPLDELREAASDLDVLRYLPKPVSLPVLVDTIIKAH